jgi:hypothetical protein
VAVTVSATDAFSVTGEVVVAGGVGVLGDAVLTFAGVLDGVAATDGQRWP